MDKGLKRVPGTWKRVPTGYRLLKDGERIPKQYQWYDADDGVWEHGNGWDTGRIQGFTPPSGAPYPHAVPITKAPKLHAWEPRTLEIGPKVTKQILVDLVRESVDEINQLGTENAKLKKQLAKLRSKIKEGK